MIILDTLKAAELFAKFDVPLSGYIVNRVVPADLADEAIPDYLRNRIQQQRVALERIDQVFSGEVLARISEFERDITGLDMISAMAQEMFGTDSGSSE